jgi:hypothetical protein
MALARRSNVTHPPEILRRFVQHYADSQPAQAAAEPLPPPAVFPVVRPPG